MGGCIPGSVGIKRREVKPKTQWGVPWFPDNIQIGSGNTSGKWW